MSSQAIGQRFRVSRGGCWQCVPDCRCRLAEAQTFSQMAYNGQVAIETGRNVILLELNPEYEPLISKRLRNVAHQVKMQFA